MTKLLKKKLHNLNKEQLKAVKHEGSPLFVVAGAGTGKTNTLTMRIAYLVQQKQVNPSSILAVTFTNKAAAEIRTRVDNLIHPFQMGSWLLTFHAFGLRIFRSHAEDLKIGYNNSFTVIDEADSKDLIKECINKLNLDSKEYKLGEIKDFISSYKMKQISNYYDDVFIEIYDKYQEELVKNQLMDFDDLIRNVYNLFKNNEDILKIYQNQFEHILIDEFQDTDKLQYEIIKMLKNENVFVVGDPDQSIYQFRGARYENNENFIKEFNAEVVVLNQNYRSTNNILKTANSLIEHNSKRTTEKDLVSDLGEGRPVNIATLETDFEEVDYIIFEINKLIRKGYNYSDIAILYRNNALSRGFEHKFVLNDIPYLIYGGFSFYQRREVKDILAYLKLVMDTNNDFFFKRIVNTPKRSIGDKTVEKIEEYSIDNNISMFDAIDKIDLPTRTLNNLKEFKEVILSIKDEIKHLDNVRQVVDLIYDKSNYREVLEKETEEVRNDRLDNIEELKTVFNLSNYYEGNNYDKIQRTLDELALITDRDTNFENKDGVILSTVHQVKGLEFKAVFVVALEEDIFPNHRAGFDRSLIDEERRLFYVAITRAKELLYLTHVNRRRLYGRFEYNLPSQFLKEIRKKDEISKRNNQAIEKSSNNKVNTNYKDGDVVNHDEFGRGIIVEIKGKVLTIAFGLPHGIKRISATHHSLEKEGKNEEV